MFGLISDFKGWKVGEYLWLAVALIVICLASAGGSALDYVTGITNILSVILVAKGRRSNYIWGLIGVLTYGYTAYNAKLYGDAALNILYYLPLQFYGLWVWIKNTHGGEPDVRVRKFGIAEWFNTTTVTVALWGIGAGILTYTQDPQPIVDSFTTVGSIVAMWLMVKRYAEQWILWILVDIVSIYMWYKATLAGGFSYAMMGMWIVFLGNAFYGAYKWFVTEFDK